MSLITESSRSITGAVATQCLLDRSIGFGLGRQAPTRPPDARHIAIASRRIKHKDIFISRRRTASRSEEHTSELQSLMRISYAVFCLKKKRRKCTHTRIMLQYDISH